MLLTDLLELKVQLDIDPADASEDKLLTFLIEQASKWVEELLDRNIAFKTRTEYYRGTGTQKLLLRSRPVNPTPPAGYTALTVVQDTGGLFGSATNAFATATSRTLVYGTDYALDIDRDDGTSRSGILYRVGDLWFKPSVRQTGLLSPFMGPDMGSYKVSYAAGYLPDNLPAQFRFGVNLLVAKMRTLLPLGVPLASDGGPTRNVSVLAENKQFLISPEIRSLLFSHKNWSF